MINKDAFQNLKGLRIYQFFLDEKTGKIIDITSRDDFVQVVWCKDCTKKELCSIFRDTRQEFGFCAWAGKKDTYVTLHHDDINFKDEESEKAFYDALERNKE